MPSTYTFRVVLHRDSLSTPWGFRLQGGKDFQTGLTIQRVFPGSPASGELQRGDIILEIDGRDATQLLHKDAHETIKRTGANIALTIRRGQPYPSSSGSMNTSQYSTYSYQPPATTVVEKWYVPSSPTLLPTHSAGGPECYIRSRHLDRVSDPKPILSQTGSYHLPSYERPRRAKTTSYRPPQATAGNDAHMLRSIQQTLQRTAQQRPAAYEYTEEFDSVPDRARMFEPRRQPWAAPRSPSTPFRPSAAPSSYAQPPWQGTLQQTSQNSFYSPLTPVPRYTPPAAANNAPNKLVNKQYNTPIGLYSREAVEEAFVTQMSAVNSDNNPGAMHHETRIVRPISAPVDFHGLPASDF